MPSWPEPTPLPANPRCCMRNEEPLMNDSTRATPPGQKYELFYWQQEGSRLYLRVTRLGLCLFVFLVIASATAILTLFSLNKSYNIEEEVNININSRHSSSSP